MRHLLMLVLALVLLPVAGWMLYANRDALQPYDPARDPNFPVGEGEPAENWRDTAQRFGWLLDYSAGLAAAAETGKPMLVVVRCVP